jgi:hypothetical protein
MAGYIGKSQGVTQVDGYTADEADSEFVNDPNGALNISSSASADSATIDASGNLLVGQTSANSFNLTSGFGFDVRQTYGLGVAVQDNPTAIFNRTNSDGDIAQFRKDGATVGVIGANGGRPYFGADNGSTGSSIQMDSLGTIPRTRTGGGSDGTYNLGSSTARWKDLYLSGGVYLGGTGSANYLDDYEEGTWTPSLTFGGANTGVAYSIAPTGYYRKIGSVVYIMFGLKLSSKGTSTGEVYVQGLPFPVAGTGSYRHPTCAVQPLIKANSKVWSGLGNISQIQFRDMTSTADTAIYNTDMVNTSSIFGSMVYHTT